MRTRDREVTITKDLIVGHEMEIMVQSVGRGGRLQAAEDSPKITVEIQGKTTGPGDGSSLTVTAGITQLYLSWSDPEDTDFDVMEIWRNTVNTRRSSSKIAEVRADYYVDELGSSGVTRYYWIRARNTSGVTGSFYPTTTAGVSGTTAGITPTEIADFAITATKRFDNTIVLTGDSWSDNTPAPGIVTWNEHYLVYGGAYYKIVTGNTSHIYIYWGGAIASGSGTIIDPYVSNYAGTAGYTSGAGVFMIATNESGVVQLVWNSSANMVIGSAFILNAAITEAKIDNLAVTTAKIDNLAVNDGKINDLSADKLTAGTINASIITVSNLTVGTNVAIGTAEDAAGVTTIVGNTIDTGYVNALEITAVGAVTAGSLTGLTIQTAAANQRIVLSHATNNFILYNDANDPVIIIDDTLWWSATPGMEVKSDNAAIYLGSDDGNSYAYMGVSQIAFQKDSVQVFKVENTGLGYFKGSLEIDGLLNADGGADIEGVANIAGLLTLQSGLAVTGDIAVTGNVDAVNIATFKSGYDDHVGNVNAHHTAFTPTNHANDAHTMTIDGVDVSVFKSAYDTHAASDDQHGHDGYVDKSPVTIDGIDYAIVNGHIAEDLT